MICVLLVASGAAWESTVVGMLAARRDVVLLKRCVDVEDLMAAATVGQADAAVVALDAPGLDATAVEHLRRHGVEPIVVVPTGADGDLARVRAARIGVAGLVAEAELSGLPDAIAQQVAQQVAQQAADQVTQREGPQSGEPPGEEPGPRGVEQRGESTPGAALDDPVDGRGRVYVVWGPAGAPGRTTVACGIAAGLAARGRDVVLVDADPYGGGIAQQVGILDQTSGLLSAARLAVRGGLGDGLGRCLREVSPGLAVVTGLPRADRYVEVRAGAVEHLVEVASAQGDVVVDTGFSLEDDPAADFGTRPARNSLTLGALGVADEIVVVGAADPVGLARLARGLVELRESTGVPTVRVVVNRNRSTLGWSQREISGMVEGFTRLHGIHFLPEDRAGVDRALVSGRTVIEAGPSALADAVEDLVDALAPDSDRGGRAGRGQVRRWVHRRRPGSLSSRRAGRARRR